MSLLGYNKQGVDLQQGPGMGFTIFPSGRLTTVTIVNSPDKKLVNPNSVLMDLPLVKDSACVRFLVCKRLHN